MSEASIYKCPEPRCGGTLMIRTNRSTGNKFYGCSNYPRCKYTEKYQQDDEDIPDAASVWE